MVKPINSYYIWGQPLLHLGPVITFEANCHYIWGQLLHLKLIITLVASTEDVCLNTRSGFIRIASFAGFPAIVVTISLAVTQANGYGNKKACWLDVKSGLIWAFIGPAMLVILVSENSFHFLLLIDRWLIGKWICIPLHTFCIHLKDLPFLHTL